MKHHPNTFQATLNAGLILISSAFIFLTGLVHASPAIQVELSSSSDVSTDQASARFGCNDKIFAQIAMSELAPGAHRLEVDWIDPTGKTREHIDYPFNGSGTTRLKIWLKLHPPKGSGIFSFINPAMGMDDFIGNWRLFIKVDDAALETQFEVVC